MKTIDTEMAPGLAQKKERIDSYPSILEQETIVVFILEDIARQMDIQKMSSSDMAKLIGVSKSAFRRMMSGRHVNLYMLIRAAQALEMSLKIELVPVEDKGRS